MNSVHEFEFTIAGTVPPREIYVELIRLHARSLRRMPWVLLLVVAGVIAFVRTHVPWVECMSWGIATLGIEAARALYGEHILTLGERFNPARIHVKLVLLTAASGMSIGAGAVLFMLRSPVINQALLGVVVASMPAAGVAMSQASRYMISAYALPMLLPTSATWIYLHPEHLIPLGALTLVYCSFLIVVAADGEHLLRRSIEIRHERDRLVLDLQHKNREVVGAMDVAEKSAQARARVLAAASHDLRQPLHALSIYSAVLSANPPAATIRELAHSIDQIVRSLGSLLHGLLDLSSFATGHFLPQMQFVALDKIVASICAEYERPAIDKGLKFIRRLQVIGVISDPVVIGRIVRNLIDNAVKYTDEGEICVELQHHDENGDQSAILTVADTGRGIPESEQARIFEEFYQLDNPGRDRTKGVGLGLAIVQRLCEAVGARIEVRSEQSKGSIFSLRLSGALENSASHQARNIGPQFAALTSRRVYVIDDEVDVVRSMTQLLKVWGADVLVPDSVERVDELFAAHGPPHLLITDLRLGRAESGAALAARLRNEYGAFPVVVITGDVGLEHPTHDDPHEFVVAFKPVTAEGLQMAIGAAFAGTGNI